MTELLTAAERYGPWLVILIYVVYKLVPVAAEKLIPDWVSNRRQDRQDNRDTIVRERETIVKVYDRFIAQNAETIKFIASATEALNSINRALDANTRQTFLLSEAIERGGSCPLPNCPYWLKGDKPPG